MWCSTFFQIIFTGTILNDQGLFLLPPPPPPPSLFQTAIIAYLDSRVTLYLKMLCPVNAQIVPFTGSEQRPSSLPNLCQHTQDQIYMP